jgi:hypothetical protein
MFIAGVCIISDLRFATTGACTCTCTCAPVLRRIHIKPRLELRCHEPRAAPPASSSPPPPPPPVCSLPRRGEISDRAQQDICGADSMHGICGFRANMPTPTPRPPRLHL